MLDTETGEFTEKVIRHEGYAVREFYAALEGPTVVGIEATGSMQWFLDLYANPRQHPQKAESILRSRPFCLRTGTRSLYLPCRSAPELRWPKSSQSLLDLYRDTQTVWPVPTPTAMHQCCFPMPSHPSARTSAATRPRTSEHGRVREGTATEKEGRSLIRGTEESDRTAPLAPAQTQVRAGAVLPRSIRTEPQALGAVPPPTGNARPTRHHLTERQEDKAPWASLQMKDILLRDFFNTHRRLHSTPPGSSWSMNLDGYLDDAVRSMDNFGKLS